jgi:hypothetical protein
MAPIRRTLTFQLAKQALANGSYICYSVKHGGFNGALLTVDGYRERVKEGGFRDYDGHGFQLTEDGKQLINTRPSAVHDLDDRCAYVLWFNT